MQLSVAVRALATWAAILLLAVANGVLREEVLIPKLGSPAAVVASGVLLSALILVAAYMALPWLGARRTPTLMAVGAGWLALTLAFEFSFGLLRGESWQAILEQYTFHGGNLWPLVLLVIAAAPWIAARLRGWL